MDISLFKAIPNIHEYLRNPLYKNSIYITLGKLSDVGFGFLFWTFAAQLYSVGEVGLATALISSLGLVIAFSRFGFDTAILRFMPAYDHSRAFNTCLWITTGMTIVVGIIYLAAIDHISPDIAFIKDYAPFFLLFAVVNSVALISGNALLSFRKADFKFIQNLIMGLRLPLLLPLILLGSLGIFYAFGFAQLAAAVFALVMIQGHVKLSPQIDKEFTRKTFRFSFLNYIASLLQSVPPLVMPILIVSLISPEDAALYYIAFAIGNLALIIPDALAISFFVEGSYGINLRKGVVRTLAAISVVLIPTILLIFFFGDILLGFFGEDYLAAFNLLRIIAISGFFVTIYSLFIPIQNLRLQVGGIVILNLIRFVLLIGLSYIFLIRFGVIGAGYAWIITYLILGIGIVGFMKGKRWV